MDSKHPMDSFPFVYRGFKNSKPEKLTILPTILVLPLTE